MSSNETMKSRYDVFLSHSFKDKEFVLRLASDLAEAGLSVWLDQWNITPGDSFARAIGQALMESRYLVIVMSPDYFNSAWTQQEWQSALASEIAGGGGIKLIPLLYRDCDIPPALRTIQWADFRDSNQYRSTLTSLVRSLRAMSSSKSTSPSVTKRSELGERVEALDPESLSELKAVLKDVVEAFRTRPETQVVTSEVVEIEEEDVCFVIMPFSVESLNIVYEDFVRPTLVDRCQLRTERGDDVFGSNVIMDDITKSIRKAHLIIADLTGRNANVFYEVGIAHALNKQVLLMTQSIDDVPFDLRHRRALVYEYSPRGCKKLEKDLYENVQNMLANRKIS